MRLVVIGDGPVKAELEEQAKELGLSDAVIFTGKVEHSALPPYLAGCNIYATASLSDTNSISMKEGMAAGLPVLQLYDELNADQIVDGVNGFVFRDAEEFAGKLRKFRDMDRQQRETLCGSVMESVSRYSAANLGRNLISVYEKAIVTHSEREPVFARLNIR